MNPRSGTEGRSARRVELQLCDRGVLDGTAQDEQAVEGAGPADELRGPEPAARASPVAAASSRNPLRTDWRRIMRSGTTAWQPAAVTTDLSPEPRDPGRRPPAAARNLG